MSDYRMFEHIGLEPRDIYVYETLYRMEYASLRRLAAETGLNRGTIYEIIKKLTNSGLVTFIQQTQRRKYQAVHPDKLTELLKEKREVLDTVASNYETYAQNLQRSHHTEPVFFAQSYEGDEGVAMVLKDVLKVMGRSDGGEYCVWSTKEASSLIYTKFKHFSKERQRMKISVRVMADWEGEPAKYAQRKLLPPSAAAARGYVILYADKTAMIRLDDQRNLTATIIDDAGLTRLLGGVFNVLWERL